MRASLPFTLALGGLVAGCAFGPGEPFAHVSPELDARWQVPDERVRPDGFGLLASGYEVRLTRAVLSVDRVSVRTLSAAGGGASAGGSFDPANPPPGYSLCHGGHCHRDDGALVSYAEVEAALAGGGPATYAEVLRLPLQREVDLLSGVTVEPPCEPSCDLGAVRLNDAQVFLEHLRLEGVVRDTLAPPRVSGEVAFGVELEAAVARAALDVAAGREHAPELALRLRLHPSPRLFDAVDWALDPGVAADESRAGIEKRLSEALEVEVKRGRL